MSQTYFYNRSKRLLILALWCMVIGGFLVVSHMDTIPYKEEVQSIEAPSYGTAESFDMMNYFERKAYERLLQRYQLRVMRTIVIAGLGLLVLFNLVRNRKIELTSQGVALFSIISKKPLEEALWEKVTNIHIGYGKGLRGITGDVGIYLDRPNKYDSIETTFISTRYIDNKPQLIDALLELNCETLPVTMDEHFLSQVVSISVKEMIYSSVSLYRQHYKPLFVYSTILIIFGFLQRYYAMTPVSSLTAGANVYFGYRAAMALNHHTFQLNNGDTSTFDKSWAYGKTQFGRYFGASLIRELSVLLCIGGMVLIITAPLSTLIKGVMTGFISIIAFLVYSRLFLVPYIASLIDTEGSYMTLNTLKWHAHTKAIVCLTFIAVLPFLVLASYMAITYVDLDSLLKTLGTATYALLMVRFLIIPFESTCAMQLLRDLKLKSETVIEGEVLDEEVI